MTDFRYICPKCQKTAKVDRELPTTTNLICPYCKYNFKADDPFTDPNLNVVATNYTIPFSPNPGVARVLSFFAPGLGHFYRGDMWFGIFWILFVPLGYLCLIIPGFVLHMYAVKTAGESMSFEQFFAHWFRPSTNS